MLVLHLINEGGKSLINTAGLEAVQRKVTHISSAINNAPYLITCLTGQGVNYNLIQEDCICLR